MNQPRDRPASSGEKERPILFSAPMVNAILDGRKTMTRRIVGASIEDHPEAWSAFTVDSTVRKYRDTWSISKPDTNGNTYGTPTGTSCGRSTELWRGKCPYGEPGDRLWVRETHADADCMYQDHTNDVPSVIAYRADRSAINFDAPKPFAIERDFLSSWNFDKLKWKPSIFMPRWASRITLEVKGVRLERLQRISEADIMAEGAVERFHIDPALGKCPISAFDGTMYTAPLGLWRAGWDSINRKNAPWSSNPWVWVVEFSRVK